MVEGKSDFYLLKYAIEILGIRPSLPLVPGGGAGSLDPLIRLYIGWGRSFLVLLDGDAEGRKQKRRYETEFGPLLGNRCVTLGDVSADHGVKEAEDLLDAPDQERLVSAVFADGAKRPGSKKALLQAVLELYGRSERVTVSQSSRRRIRALLQELEAQVSAQD